MLVSLFLIPSTPTIVKSISKKLDICILLKRDSLSLELFHKKGFSSLSQNSISFTNEKSTFFPFFKKTTENSHFFIIFQPTFSLNESIAFSKKQLSGSFKNSDMSFFIQERQKELKVLLGPFQNKTEAEFIKKNLTSYAPCGDIMELPKKSNFVCFTIENRLLYISSFFPADQNSLAFNLSSPEQTITFNNRAYPDAMLIFWCKNQTLSLVNQTDLETYLLGVVPSEMPDSWHMEALKAQSIVSRTYALSRLLQARKAGSYFDVTDDTMSQVYLGKRSSVNAPQAIKSTEGMILTYKNLPIDCVFHSTSGGFTENNDKIWNGSPAPYLRAMPSPGEEISPHFSWCNRFSMEDFLAKLNQYLTKEKKKTIHSLQSITILEKGESPRVRKVELSTDIGSITLSGSTVQQLFSLKSTWFEFLLSDMQEKPLLTPLLSYFYAPTSPSSSKTEKPYVYIYGRGWGHGVGMSQYGALAQAKKGVLYPVIVSSFFSQTTISSLDKINIIPSNIAPSASCSLSFRPEALTMKNNDNQEVIIQINTSPSVFGISFDLIYPNHIISLPLEEIRVGTFLKSDGKNVLFQKNETESEVKIALSREGRSSGGVSGKGDLLLFRLKSVTPGIGKIEIRNLQVFDAQLNTVFADSQSCNIEVIVPDLTPPKTQIIVFPDRFSNKKMVYFEWTGIDNQTLSQNLLFSYRLNDEPWSVYSKERSHYFNIPVDGSYVFFVKSRDESGNEDPFPPSYTFSIDLTPPRLTINHYPEKTNLKQITLTGDTEPGVTLLVNGQPLVVQKDGQFSYLLSLEPGKNVFRLIAIDQASNTSTKDIVIERIFKKNVVINMTIGSSKAMVNDQVVTMDIAPLIKEGRTLVPLRFIAEAFGASIVWNAALEQIDITLQTSGISHVITLWIGKKKAMVDSQPYTLESAPITIPPGRTIVPIRFIAEALESSVEWQPLTRSIVITFPKIKPEE